MGVNRTNNPKREQDLVSVCQKGIKSQFVTNHSFKQINNEFNQLVVLLTLVAVRLNSNTHSHEKIKVQILTTTSRIMYFNAHRDALERSMLKHLRLWTYPHLVNNRIWGSRLWGVGAQLNVIEKGLKQGITTISSIIHIPIFSRVKKA